MDVEILASSFLSRSFPEEVRGAPEKKNGSQLLPGLLVVSEFGWWWSLGGSSGAVTSPRLVEAQTVRLLRPSPPLAVGWVKQ
jgi:hypothetical protein